MQLRSRSAVSAVAALVTLLSACSGAGDTSDPGSALLEIQPPAVDVAPGDSVKFAAVGEESAGPVSWKVVEPGGGTVDAEGNYVAPDAEGTFHVAASSGAQGPAVEATVRVNRRPPSTGSIAVSVQPKAAGVAAGATLSFSASVTGTGDRAVTWSVEEAGGGSITSAGVYSAPQTAGTYHVVARSAADATKLDRATVTVTAPPAPSPPPPGPAPTGPQLYVATDGNDSNPGTESQPWRTIQKAMSSATPGSTVNIKAGTYRERLSLNVSGTAGQTITFQPYGFAGAPSCGGYTGSRCAGDEVILDYSSLGTVSDGVPFLRISGRSYVRIQGLTFQNYTCIGAMQQGLRIDGSSSFVELRHNRFLNNKNTYPNFDGTNAFLHARIWTPASNVLVYGNEFGGINTVQSEVLTVHGASNVTIERNWLHDTDGIAIDILSDASNVTIRANLLEWIGRRRDGSTWYNNPTNAVYADGGNHSVIEHNVVRDSEYAYAVVAEPNSPANHDLIIRNNVAYRNRQAGIMLGNWYSSTDGSSVYNIQVLNNTLYGNRIGFYVRPYTSGTISWRNNIVAGSEVAYVNTLNWPVGTMDYNLYSGGGSGPDAHKVLADPQFANAGAADFRLNGTSPAIGSGDPGVTTSEAGALDFGGNARVVNGRIDIGAHEGG